MTDPAGVGGRGSLPGSGSRRWRNVYAWVGPLEVGARGGGAKFRRNVGVEELTPVKRPRPPGPTGFTACNKRNQKLGKGLSFVPGPCPHHDPRVRVPVGRPFASLVPSLNAKRSLSSGVALQRPSFLALLPSRFAGSATHPAPPAATPGPPTRRTRLVRGKESGRSRFRVL